jgi:zinc/manganese transport system substrate-binding protein
MNRIGWMLLLALVGIAPAPAGAADRLRVVATFSVIGDIAANIGADNIELATLVGPGGDSELFQPTAADAATAARANVLLMNGINETFEPWLDKLLKQSKFAGTKVVVSRGVKALSSDDEHPTGGKPVAVMLDQHAWLDPRNGIIYAKNIADTLIRADPAHAEDFRARAAAYTKKLQALDVWARGEMASVPTAKRRALSSHDSMQYLASAFNITLISVNGWTNNTEPTAAELAKLTSQIRREKVHALFLDSITDSRAMERIARETGATIGGTLYGDSLSKPDGEANSYLNMIRHDIEVLKVGMLLN